MIKIIIMFHTITIYIVYTPGIYGSYLLTSTITSNISRQARRFPTNIRQIRTMMIKMHRWRFFMMVMVMVMMWLVVVNTSY